MEYLQIAFSDSFNLFVSIVCFFIITILIGLKINYNRNKSTKNNNKTTKTVINIFIIITLVSFIVNYFNHYTNITFSYSIIISVFIVLFYLLNFYIFTSFIFNNKYNKRGDRFLKVFTFAFLILFNYFIYSALRSKISDIKYVPKHEVDLIVNNLNEKGKYLDSLNNVVNIQLDSLKIKEQSLLEQRLILINKINDLPKRTEEDKKFLQEFLNKYKNLY